MENDNCAFHVRIRNILSQECYWGMKGAGVVVESNPLFPLKDGCDINAREISKTYLWLLEDKL